MIIKNLVIFAPPPSWLGLTILSSEYEYEENFYEDYVRDKDSEFDHYSY